MLEIFGVLVGVVVECNLCQDERAGAPFGLVVGWFASWVWWLLSSRSLDPNRQRTTRTETSTIQPTNQPTK